MNWFEALVLGLIQGLTEYLPVSSSGHLAIGAYLFGIDGEANLGFTVLVHVATVMSTLVVLWKEIDWILKGLFKFQMNEETKYALNIVVSMIPVGVVGVFFKDEVEKIFGSGLLIVGCMLLVTALLLAFSYYAKPRQRENISLWHAFVIGLGQALAVLPGLSRSGTTIATGLLLGNKKEKMAQFSFLMVIPPIRYSRFGHHSFLSSLISNDKSFARHEFPDRRNHCHRQALSYVKLWGFGTYQIRTFQVLAP